MNKLSRVGLDLTKNVFQLHGVDRHGKAVWRQRLARNNWLTALLATVGNAEQFANGRQMAASLGLMPKQPSSGGKDRLLGIGSVAMPVCEAY